MATGASQAASPAVLLALVAAACFALGAWLQQHAARQHLARPATATGGAGAGGPARPRWLPAAGALRRMLRDRRWLAGAAAGAAGFACHVTALHLGSVTVVQALLVTQLLFALPLGRTRPPADAWLGTVAICGGLMLLLVGRPPAPRTLPSGPALGLVCLAGAAWVGLLVAAAGTPTGRPALRAALLGVASGSCCSLTAMFVAVLGDRVLHPGAGLLPGAGWPALGVLASTGCGGLILQEAYAAGAFTAALTATTVTDPMSSAVLDTVLLGAPPPATAPAAAGHLAAALLICLGAVALARAPGPTAIRPAGSRDLPGRRPADR